MPETASSVEKANRESLNLKDEQIKQLKRLFPEVVADGKVNWEKLKAILGETVDTSFEKFSFTWAGKGEAIRNVLVPSKATLRPDKKESVRFDQSQNVFIEGDNLEVLKLLHNSYYGRVKMIYIDPPYNTGNDFVYKDDFKRGLRNYLEQTGQVDSDGNRLQTLTEASGRLHSDWLTMMYPRLKLAWHLLSDDGVMFVSIDDNELHHLRMIMNEIFGEECFKNAVIFKRGIKSVQAQFETVDSLTVGHEYVLMFSKSPETRFRKLAIELEEAREGGWNNHWRGTDRPTMRYTLLGVTPKSGQWRWGKDRSLRAVANYKLMLQELDKMEKEVAQADIDKWYLEYVEKTGEEIDLLRLSSSGKPEHYIPPSDTKLGSDLWTDISPRGSAEIKRIFGFKAFDNPKPVNLIKRMLDVVTNKETHDIVFDFFAGSGTTAEAVLVKNAEDGGNRTFILVQMPEPVNPKSEAYKKGFKTVSSICMERIRGVIKGRGDESQALQDGCKVFNLASSSYPENNFEYDPKKSEQGNEKAYKAYLEKAGQLDLFSKVSEEDLVYENIIKEGLDLNSKIAEISLGKNKVFQAKDEKSEILVCLDSKITDATVKALSSDDQKGKIFICYDKAVDDSAKANLGLHLSLRTI